MKKVFKIILGITGGLASLVLLTVLYFMIAPTIIGPKTEAQNFCSAIPSGTTTEDLAIIIGDHGLQPIDGTIENSTLQVDLQFQNGWVCICQVEMENGKVSHPNDVFCSD